jgi:hypothetical protein
MLAENSRLPNRPANLRRPTAEKVAKCRQEYEGEKRFSQGGCIVVLLSNFMSFWAKFAQNGIVLNRG